MKYHELKTTTTKPKGRVGRGISAGQGKTAGRGTKGQKSRAGSGKRPGFEGGQNPLMQRLPKLRGFRSGRPETENVRVTDLADLKGKADNFSLHEAGLTSSPYARVKIIGNGELKTKVIVSAQGASEASKASIQKAGGTFTAVPRPQRAAKK